MEETETLLSDLCSVCHLVVPKYKCPRCSTRTCSLACSKRHKLRAECSGVRDPTRFLPKSKLETEQTFDHDYNFLSSLERNLGSNAAGNRQSLLNGEPDHRKRNAGGMRREHYWNAVRRANVRVVRAPEGMARSKENGSRLGARSKMLIWTVEWLFEDGQRCLMDGIANTSIGHGYDIAIRALERRKMPKSQKNEDDIRGTEPTDTSDKMIEEQMPQQQVEELGETAKEEASSVTVGDQIIVEDQKDDAGQVPQQQEVQELDATIKDQDNSLPEADQIGIKDQRDDAEQEKSSMTEPVQSSANSQATLENDTPKKTSHKSTRKRKRSTPPLPDNVFLYLLKARTSGSQKVLIPVNSHDTLGKILRNREVIEFPTFQVLSTPPGEISAPFIIEAEYTENALKEEEEIRELASAADDLVANPDRDSTKTDKAKKLENGEDMLAILKRDILGV